MDHETHAHFSGTERGASKGEAKCGTEPNCGAADVAEKGNRLRIGSVNAESRAGVLDVCWTEAGACTGNRSSTL